MVVTRTPAEQDAVRVHGGRGRSTTRQRILDVALRQFAARGFDGTDIVDIERQVGLTPGSGGFYRHFRNKEAVLHAAVDAEIARVQELGYAPGTNPARSAPEQQVAGRVARMLEMLWEMRQLLAVLAHDSARFPELQPRIAALMASAGVALDATELRRLMDSGVIVDRPADMVATAVMMAGVGYTFAETLFGRPIDELDRARFGQVLADLVTGR